MKKHKLSNSPLAGIVLALLFNGLTLLLLISVGRYVSVAPRIFIGIVGAIVVLALLGNLFFILGYGYRKKIMRKTFVAFSIILSIILSVGSFYLVRVNTSIDALIEKDNQEILEYNFVTINDFTALETLSQDKSIGFVAGDNDFNESIEKEIALHSTSVDIIEFNSYQEMLDDFLVEETLDVAILPKQFMSYAANMDSESQEELETATIIHTFNIKVKGEKSSNTKVLEEPFSILFLGINENLADSIILATINPQTLHVTMTSIARDLYVPISCYRGNVPDKINHSRNVSRNCLIDTVNELMEIEIDFFIETDFYALVKIVDVLGGLEIESPISFAGSLPKEEDPRVTEDINIPEGKHLLNGKQVITFARERHHFPNGDFQRQLNQQYVIKELATKIIDESKRNVETLIQVIRAAEDNIVMNMSVNNDISPLMGLALSNVAASPVAPIDTFVIQSSQIYGTTPMINGMSVIVPYVRSLEDNKAIIHNNLKTEIKEPQAESFSYSINYPYDFEIDTNIYQYVGTETYYPNTIYESTEEEDFSFYVPNFMEMGLSEAQNWASNNGVSLNVIWIDGESEGRIVYQDVRSGDRDFKPESISIEVENGSTYVEEVYQFEVIDLTSKSYNGVMSWAEEHGISIVVVEENDPDLDYEQDQVIAQSVPKGLYETKPNTITITLYKKEEVE